MILAALSGGWVIIGIAAVIFVGLVVGYYANHSRQRISHHPIDDRGDSPGAQGPSRMSSAESPEELRGQTHPHD